MARVAKHPSGGGAAPRARKAGNEIRLRLARPEDVPALARMGAALARWHHAVDPDRFFGAGPLEEGYAWWLSKERRNPRAVVLAAVRSRSGRAVGYAYGRIEPRDWNTLRDRCGVGIDLVVEPDVRRSGIGRWLVDELSRRLASKGAPRLVIQVAARNREARRVFARLGFRETMVEMTREILPGRRRRLDAGRRPVRAPRIRGTRGDAARSRA